MTILSPAGDIPGCAAPLAFVRPPNFAIPAFACDTHAHVIGDMATYPQVANRSYTPPVASEESYLAMLDAQGMARGVLIQVSIYGTDNSCMVDVLRRHPDRLRGVAVVSPDVSDAELQELHNVGVRGIRINVLFGGGVAMSELERLAARVAELGWHVQLLMDVSTLPDLSARIAKLPVDVVFDHIGHMPVSAGIDHPGFKALVELMKNGRTWTKLSGAYRISSSTTPFLDTIPFAQAIAAVAPDRCLWGSDWPHVALQEPMFNTGDLLDLFALWVPDEAMRHRILVDNPARLYDFPAAKAE